MGAVVITGGTDGIGRALATVYLRRGHDVLVVGRSTRKGQEFITAATDLGAGDRAHYVTADLSRIGENQRLIQAVTTAFPVVDVLVLGARYHRSTRTVTSDGFETNFALFYLSRFLLSHGLVDPLNRAENPVILNFGGAGQTGPVRWDDLQLEHRYHGVDAMGHSARLNDLLGVSFTTIHEDSPIRYVLNHPGVVVTSFAGEYDAVTAAQVAHLKQVGKTVADSVAQILPYLDPPGTGRLTAVLEGVRVPLEPSIFDHGAAARLHEVTERLLVKPRDQLEFIGRTAHPA
ncbi:SDR family NAD(P)-dependent oxidoreductase [Nocardia sp. CA-129566]|uniref:SDR family NAD(P)-dependent oxidoreductase n=1 Tax=Nocardia sp. CA-129566 TaxID=3239976 RepID=UPI003D9832C3